MAATGSGLRLTLRYRVQQGAEDVAVSIRLTSTAGFGGRRWWFVCPLAAGGV